MVQNVKNRKKRKRAETGPAVYESVREFAGELGIGYHAAYKGLTDGTIPVGIRVGSRWVIPKAAVSSWLASAGGRLASA